MANKEEEEEASLHGDLLDAIISHVPLIHLVPASFVSKSWRRAVSSTLRNPSRSKPWLIIHAQSPWNPSLILTRAYDPSSHVWIEITCPPPSTTDTSTALRSSHSNTLYMLNPSKFSFSSDPLHETWQNLVGPHVWRTDPIVAVVGSYVVVAGGTCDFEDDPLSVEIYDMASPGWATCQPMPIILKDSAATTWVSVAASGERMYLLEKNSGKFCSFNPNANTWSGSDGNLRPDPSIYFSVIVFTGHRLILVGLIGDAENAESLRLWEVNCDNFECEEIGKMPWAMFERLKNSNSMLLQSIDISAAENFVYIYNVSSDPKEIFFCEFNGGSCECECEWGSVWNSLLTDRTRMDRFVFTCSKVSLDDLRKAFWLGSRKFNVEFAAEK